MPVWKPGGRRGNRQGGFFRDRVGISFDGMFAEVKVFPARVGAGLPRGWRNQAKPSGATIGVELKNPPCSASSALGNYNSCVKQHGARQRVVRVRGTGVDHCRVDYYPLENQWMLITQK